MITTHRDGRPIHWTDKAGLTHLAEGDWLTPHDFCLWTRCGSADVPAGKGYLPGDNDPVVRCPTCLAVADQPNQK